MDVRNNQTTDFILSFNDMFGYDIAALHIDDVCFHGYFEKSPIENRLIANFNYVPLEDNSKKPYRAHWMIYESKLLLGYVNGEINGLRFNTVDVVPEFQDDDLLFTYYEYSGNLKFSIQQNEVSAKTNKFMKRNFNTLILSFENGILLKTEEI